MEGTHGSEESCGRQGFGVGVGSDVAVGARVAVGVGGSGVVVGVGSGVCVADGSSATTVGVVIAGWQLVVNAINSVTTRTVLKCFIVIPFMAVVSRFR